jgi:hypothetical protein
MREKWTKVLANADTEQSEFVAGLLLEPIWL